MEPIANALRELGIVHNIELPGHGETPLAEGVPFSIQTFVDALHAKVRTIAITSIAKPLVFGYSMGGYVALTLESQHPATLGGILTLGTKFAWTPEVASREGSRLNADIIAEKVPKFAAALEARHLNAGGWRLLLERTAALLAQLGEAPPLTSQSLSRVQAKTCVALGERDETLTADEAREFAGHVPAARFESIPEAPHPIEKVPADRILSLLREHT